MMGAIESTAGSTEKIEYHTSVTRRYVSVQAVFLSPTNKSLSIELLSPYFFQTIFPLYLGAQNADAMAVANGYQVRRLTPVECERLQGFPDGYTNVPYGKRMASDAQRYHALGNSMAVPVMRWIGEQIIEKLKRTTRKD